MFLFLAVFMMIACFNTDGAFIAFFADLVKGLIGWGFWLTAPVFLLLAYILLFHKGRPVSLRVSAALLLPGYCRGHASAYAVRFHVGKF